MLSWNLPSRSTNSVYVKKSHPVVHVHVEGAEKPAVLPRPALEELARLDLSRFTEVVDQEVAHLPAVPHFLGHDPADAVRVVVRGRGFQQVALLLDGRELRVALVDDQVQECVPDRLVGDLRQALPLLLRPGSLRTRSRRSQVAVLRLEGVVGVTRQAQVDVLLPAPEGVDPVVEGRDLFHRFTRALYHTRPAGSGRLRPAWRCGSTGRA